MLFLLTQLSFAQYIQKDKALEDLESFKQLMETESSYYQLSGFDFDNRFTEIAQTLELQDSVAVYYLAYELEKIIAETIDRHASVKIEDFKESDYKLLNQYFPMILSSLDGKVVALRDKKSEDTYEYFSKNYPFVESINGMNVSDFLAHYAYKSKSSPAAARLMDGLLELSHIGKLYFKQGDEYFKNSIDVTLTNGKKNKTFKLPLADQKKPWSNMGSLRYKSDMSSLYTDVDFDLSRLDRWLTDSIAYLAIPAMANFKKNKHLEPYIKLTIEKFRNAKALIIDLRGNGGGTRDILNTLSEYFIQPEQSPWVANVAYVRSDQRLSEDLSSMQGRYLYNYNSNSLSDTDRRAIDDFNSSFKTEQDFDTAKFSSPFYMVLHSSAASLNCQVYILVNEESFSAASVFTSAFKGLPNVKIAGVNTNGSSGRSVFFTLKNSNIRIRLSTMLSFQRNGKTLDGNGTAPDIVIEKREAQIMGKADTQLEDLIHWIENKATH